MKLRADKCWGRICRVFPVHVLLPMLLMSPRKKLHATSQRQSRKRSAGGKPSRRGDIVTQRRAHQVETDMIDDPLLAFTRAAHRRRIDPRTVLKHLPGRFQKDSSGRIKARAVTGRRKILYIPWFKPGEVMPVPTKSKAERLLVGRWMTALNAARDGHFSKIDNFPKDTVIGGVRLPTRRTEIQQILKSLADRESPFEGLYCTIARRS